MSADVERLIALAISAAGPITKDPGEWEDRVRAAIPVVASFFDPRSQVNERAELVATDMVGFFGFFHSLELEERTRRWILTTDSGKVEDGQPVLETIRTDFENTAMGMQVLGVLRTCQPGDSLVCFRVNEAMRDNPKKKVRVLYHVKLLQRAKDSTGGHPSPPGGQAAAPPAAAPVAPRSVPHRGGGHTVAEFMRMIPKLPPDTKVKLASKAHAAGITISNHMSDDQLFQVSEILRDIEQDHGEEPF